MSFSTRGCRLMVVASLLCAAGLAGACASHSAGVASVNEGALAAADASREAVELQWRHAALATAFLGRAGELDADAAYPQDPDRHVAYEQAARQMLTRASEFLNAHGVVFVEGGTPEADAVEGADVRRVETEYAAQAVALQREVVRLERRLNPGMDWSSGVAATDMAVLQALGGAVVSVPLNTGKGGTGGGSGAGATLPTVAAGGNGGATPAGEGGAAHDEAAKRRGFATHPGYQPTPPK